MGELAAPEAGKHQKSIITALLSVWRLFLIKQVPAELIPLQLLAKFLLAFVFYNIESSQVCSNKGHGAKQGL